MPELIFVIVIVGSAAFFIGRRFWRDASGQSSCGCGSCGKNCGGASGPMGIQKAHPPEKGACKR